MMITQKITKLKICFLIPSVSSGGIEMYLLRFLKYLIITDNITVIVRSNQRGELYNEYQATGANLVFMPLDYLNPGKIWQHYQFYKNNTFDVICDFNANFAGIPMFLGKKLNVQKRIVFYRQGSDHFKSSFIKNKVNKYMNCLVYKHATHILSNSQAALDFFFSYRTSADPRFKVIYNGVNIKEYQLKERKEVIRKDLGIPKDAFVIGHVGRLDKAKNHETILKVFKQLQKENVSTYLVLCGRNTEKLLPQVVAMGINTKTKILGYRKDIPRVLKSFDCFLFPSITEGQPNALIEAMVAGLPIVASNIPAIKECVPINHLIKLQNPFDVAGLKAEIMNIIQQNFEKNNPEDFQKFDAQTNFEVFKKIVNG